MAESDKVAPGAFLKRESAALYGEIASGRTSRPGPSPQLEELLALGLIAADPEDLGRYEALDPAQVGRRVQERLLEASARQVAQARAALADLTGLLGAYHGTRPTVADAVAVEMVESKAEVQSRLAPIMAACSVELLTAQPDGPRPAAMLAMSYQRDLAALSRGVEMRTIYRADARGDAPTARWVLTVVEHGAQVRTVPVGVEFPRTVIVDRQVAVIGTDDPERAAIVRDPSLVRYIRLAWLRDWESALPWTGEPDVAVSPNQAAILDRLAAGDALDVIARAQGVSRRMIAHRLEPLKDATGARSTAALVYWWAKHEAHYRPVPTRSRSPRRGAARRPS